MRKKQFKAESKKLLDMMINSIYIHKEIFLRELISNASDATDKLYFKSLTDDSVKATKDDLKIRIDLDKDARTITVSDNGIGMTAEELEQNLGTIAKSDSLDFKNENADNEKADDIEVIGQLRLFQRHTAVTRLINGPRRAQTAILLSLVKRTQTAQLLLFILRKIPKTRNTQTISSNTEYKSLLRNTAIIFATRL